MPTYSTGELAKLAGVTVRTVQHYDRCGILTPSELTSGGRRIYTDDDAHKLRVICFLRDLGLSIPTISDIFSQPNSENVLVTLLNQRATELEEEIEHHRETLTTTRALLKHIAGLKEPTSLEALTGMAAIMTSYKQLEQFRKKILFTRIPWAIPPLLAEIVTFIIGIIHGTWLPFLIAVLVALLVGVIIAYNAVPIYYKQVAYLCPECHTSFKPSMREFFWAPHTPQTRKLTCSTCGHRGYCVEVYDDGSVVAEATH